MNEPKDIQDLTEKVAQKKPLDVDEALNVTKEIAHQIPSLEENMKKIQAARGAVLESSTHIEKVFDEILIRANQPKMIYSSTFMEKAKFIRKLMEVFDPNKEILQQEFLEKLEKVVTIRNLFAHVPIDYFKDKLEFDSSEKYLHFFKGDLNLKDVSYGANLFIECSKEILQKTVEFIKIVLKVAEDQRTFMNEINRILQGINKEDE